MDVCMHKIHKTITLWKCIYHDLYLLFKHVRRECALLLKLVWTDMLHGHRPVARNGDRRKKECAAEHKRTIRLMRLHSLTHSLLPLIRKRDIYQKWKLYCLTCITVKSDGIIWIRFKTGRFQLNNKIPKLLHRLWRLKERTAEMCRSNGAL